MNQLTALPVPVQAFGLLILSNLFMTFAWYGHLKHQGGQAWWVAALVSWGIALFEYLLQVPGNRIGYAGGPAVIGLCSRRRGAAMQMPIMAETRMAATRSPE